MNKNRNPIKQWFITFPQVAEIETKSEFVEKLPPSVYSICCEEEHKDGGKHLHIAVKLKKGISTSRMVKWIMEKYPEDWKRIHFKAVKKMEDCVDYCNKEDPKSFVTGSLETVKARRYTPEEALKDVQDIIRTRFRDRRLEERYEREASVVEAEVDTWCRLNPDIRDERKNRVNMGEYDLM